MTPTSLRSPKAQKVHDGLVPFCFKIEPSLPSINTIYSSPHWSLRRKLQASWKQIVAANLKAHIAYNHIMWEGKNEGKPMFRKPVKITVENFAKRPLDAWNFYTKCLDALEGIIIETDGWKHVVETRCITRKVSGKESCSITIEAIKTIEAIEAIT